MNITTNIRAQAKALTQKQTLTTRVNAGTCEGAAHNTRNFAASQDQPQSEVSELSRIPSWKQAIIRYQRRQAKRLEAQQPTLVLGTAKAESPARIPSWKQAIIRYQRRQAKRLEAQQPTLVLETAKAEAILTGRERELAIR